MIIVMERDLAAPIPPRVPIGSVPRGSRWSVDAPTLGFTGYCRLARHVRAGLDGAGMLAPDADPARPILRLAPPMSPPPGGSAPWVALTMWESSALPPGAAEALSTAEAVVVPCRWNAEVFRACGVTRPIAVVPLGVDTREFLPTSTNRPDRPFTVGMAARLSHGGVRKGIEEGAAAFLEAAEDDPSWRLLIKCFPDCLQLFSVPDDPRIVVQSETLTAAEVPAWYRGLDVLLVPSKAEGWGLHSLEALACGVPVIASRVTGTAEFFDESCGWELPYEASPARGLYAGLGDWYPPTYAGMVEALRLARGDDAARRRKALRARDRAEAYTWERTGRELAGVLRGLEARPRPKADASRPACAWIDRCNCTEAKCHHPTARTEFGDARGLVGAADCRKCGGRPTNLADVGDGVFVGDFHSCDQLAPKFPNVIHIWKPENITEDRLCGACKAGEGFRVEYAEGQPLATMSATIDEVAAYARRPGEILIHCAAGACRSAALGVLAKVARGRSPSEAMAEVAAGIRSRRGFDPTLSPAPMADIERWATTGRPTVGLSMLVGPELLLAVETIEAIRPHVDAVYCLVDDRINRDGLEWFRESAAEGLLSFHTWTWTDQFVAGGNLAHDRLGTDVGIYLDTDERMLPESAALIRPEAERLIREGLDGMTVAWRHWDDLAMTRPYLEWGAEIPVPRMRRKGIHFSGNPHPRWPEGAKVGHAPAIHVEHFNRVFKTPEDFTARHALYQRLADQAPATP